MSNRIIDLSLSAGITGTESIPGTEQVSASETTPKNKRYTWNQVLLWLKNGIAKRETYTFEVDNIVQTGILTFPAGTSIIGVALCEDSPNEEMIDTVSLKVGTTAGGDDILPLTEIPIGNSNGERIALSYFKNAGYSLYLTLTAYPTSPEYTYLVKAIFETIRGTY